MTDYINQNGLDELTQDFLSSFPKNVHMSWSEWLEKAEAYGLDGDEIAELEQHLEVSGQLTSPVTFAGRRWWLTKSEIGHIEVIKQYFGVNWESEVLDRMQSKELGDIKKDWRLKERKKTQRSTK
ncbi:hypothetical protein QT995_26780 [Microcoleus sp. S36b_A3]|uniref:hypothetical protein n=1 Tax=unclassified Microcoleus TaxID=2642155 RepID=UPI002FD76A75